MNAFSALSKRSMRASASRTSSTLEISFAASARMSAASVAIR
jgi:hypothetical protein